MIKSKYKWKLNNETVVDNEGQLLDILLSNRCVKDRERFFKNEDFFYDPFLFNEMKNAVDRIKLAIENNEKIMLYGDYDVDGVTGTAILYKTLAYFNANVDYYIPNRFREGYGPNLEAFRKFVERDYKLIITIDNGISGVDEAKYLKDNNVDLIITDHHEGKDIIPEAYAIIHPKLPNEAYPFKDLSGCGVAFKVSHALLGFLPIEYVDLACLGTFADIVSVLDENRSIIKLGLKQLSKTLHLGLSTITKIADVKVFDEYALGFVYGPRLNAPGRMLEGNDAVKLLVTDNVEEALLIASNIEQLNKDRKATIDSIIEEAIEMIEDNNYHNDNVIVIAKDNWHEGVLGIVANRLVDLYSKPVIVLTENENIYKGSCRTLEDFPLFENLAKCCELLDKYGGHKMAAGISLCKENINELRKRLNELAGTDLCNVLNIDCIPHYNLINTNVIKGLESFKPFGPLNQEPIFLLKDYEIASISQMGSKNKHLRLILKKDNINITAVAFNKGYLYNILNEKDIIDVVGKFEINEYNNKTTNQIMIKDIRCNTIQVFDYRSKQVNMDLFNNENTNILYFENNFGYNNALKFTEDEKYKNLVLIDLPNSIDDLNLLFKNNKIENIYLLLRCNDLFSSEHLLTREKMAKLYQVLKKYKRFKINESRVQNELISLGYDKKIQNIAIKVFFELNFVIIENDEIILVENPEKRNLTDSKTYQKINESIQLKEKLLLSSTDELKEFILKLSNGG